MTKPNNIERWAWNRAEIIVSKIEADFTWGNRQDGHEEVKNACELIARALMKAKAEQRETDALRIEANMSYLAQTSLKETLKSRELKISNKVCSILQTIATAIRTRAALKETP